MTILWTAESGDAPGAYSADFSAIDTGVFYTGAKSYRLTGTSNGFRYETASSQLKISYFYRASYTNSTANYHPVLFGFYTTSITTDFVHGVVYNNQKQLFELYVNSVLVATASANQYQFLRPNVWYSSGVTIKTGSSGFLSFYLNGEKILTYTGNVPAIVGVGVANRFSFFSLAATAYVDDVIIEDVSGSDVDPSNVRYQIIRPNATGNDAQWSPTGAGSNYQAVNETTANDDTSYNSTGSNSQKDTFNFDNTTNPLGCKPKRVLLRVRAKKTESGSASIKLHAYDGSTYQTSSAIALTTSYAPYTQEFAAKNDASAWDESSINSYQFGYESVL